MTDSQTVELFNKLTKAALELGVRIEVNNGFCICYDEQLLNHFNELEEVKVYLDGFKAAQMIEAY